MQSAATAQKATQGRIWGDQPFWRRAAASYALLLLLLLLLERLSFRAAQMPLTLTTIPTSLTLTVDGASLHLPLASAPTQVTFVRGDPTVREFQLDGTDSINNFSQDPTYLHQIATTPYYRFQAWMRDFDSYSSWHDVTVRDTATGRTTTQLAALASSASVALPPAGAILSATIQRLEVPVQVVVFCGGSGGGSECGLITIDRNNRSIQAQTFLPNGAVAVTQKVYFPTQPIPFIADVVNLLLHVAIWAWLLLGVCVLLQTALVALWSVWEIWDIWPARTRIEVPTVVRRLWRSSCLLWRRLCVALPVRDQWDVAAGAIVLAAFAFTIWIALAEYQAQPHILDASAYFFQAKIFASGRLSVPVPANLPAFQGPFMVADQGRWFAQYPPATSALLAIGLLVHAPWLVEPLLGAAALWGVYQLGRLMFSRGTALLAVLLGALSPLYLYLAASYLSHTIALFFGVYFLLFFLRFDQNHRQRDLILAAVCAGGMFLTREFSAVLLCSSAIVFILVWHRRSWLREWKRIARLALAPLGVLLVFALLYLAYNAQQTGDPLLLPRTVFYPADRYGFGQGIGFYGEHTLAAGFVNLGQLLTILLIDLYGWPFYLTLAFIPLAFLRRWQQLGWDVFCLTLGGLLILAQVGYFYHGIYLGPRYLFEALPFLLLLSARGINGLFGAITAFARRCFPLLQRRLAHLSAGLLVLVLLAALIGCNLGYYLPRQIVLYHDYTGLPVSQPLQVNTIYGFHPAQAIIVTNDWYIYNYVLFPLNAPDLNGATLYAYAASGNTVQELEKQYPSRSIYLLQVGPNGAVTFLQVPH